MPRNATSAAIRFFVAEKDGIVQLDDPEKITLFPEVRHMKILVQNGEEVRKTDSNSERLGNFIVYSEDNTAGLIANQTFNSYSLNIL